MSFRWKQTNAALDEFFELLRCGFCKKTLRRPTKLTVCGHTFCQDCCAMNKLVCVECKMPIRPNEMQPHHLMAQLINNCNAIKQTIQQMNIEALQENKATSKSESKAESTTVRSPTTPDSQVCRNPDTSDADLETPGYRDPTQFNSNRPAANDTDGETPGYRDSTQMSNKHVDHDLALETPGYRDPTQISEPKDKCDLKMRSSKKLDPRGNVVNNCEFDTANAVEKYGCVDSGVLVGESAAIMETWTDNDERDRITVPETMETAENDTITVDNLSSDTIAGHVDSQLKANRLASLNLSHNRSSTSPIRSGRESVVMDCRRIYKTRGNSRKNSMESADGIANDENARQPRTPRKNNSMTRDANYGDEKNVINGRTVGESSATIVNRKNSPRKIAKSPKRRPRICNRLAVPKIMPKDPNKCNTKGESRLHEACIRRQENYVKKLLELGANPNTKDNANWTPLQEAVTKNRNICKTLLEAGASPNIPGFDNKTPLHEAVINDKYDEVVLLLRYNANRDVYDKEGKRPLDYAESNKMRTLLIDWPNIDDLNTDVDFCPNNTLDQSISTINAKPVVFASNLNNENKKLLIQMAPKLVFLVTSLSSSEVTHIVVEANDRNIAMLDYNVMRAILKGKWILNSQWISIAADTENPSDIDFQLFEVRGAPYPGTPERCRKNEEIKNPRLFNNCIFHFTIGASGSWNYGELKLDKHQLTRLVYDGEGEVLNREPDPEFVKDVRRIPFHVAHLPTHSLRQCSHYIVYMPGKSEPRVKYNMPHIKALPLAWFIECIEKFELVDPISMGIL